MIFQAFRLWLGGLAIVLLWILYRMNILLRRQRARQRDDSLSSRQGVEKGPYHNITPLPDFEWAETSPIQNAVFKPKYHLTMALENIPLSDIIALDNTYAERMHVRTSLIDENPIETIGCNPICGPAVLELHDWIFRTYLPNRFPKTYYLNSAPEDSLYNTANATSIPLFPVSPLEALQALGEHVDTDFFLLLPSSQAADGSPIYHLQAFVNCFPSGFTTREKLGLPLADIHAPVPGYQAKLERSMDRFFARLDCGKAVKRSNWTITTDDVLFKQGGTHFHDSATSDEEKEEIVKQQRKEVVVENCRIRSERQTLFRLPHTKAIVFSFKTYLYKLSEAKDGGYAEALVEAIKGLKMGNVPEMNHYKRATVWAEPVIEFLVS